MGRRYTNTMAQKKDVITYHIYVDGEFQESIESNKELAKEKAATYEGSVEIRKTRVHKDLDKSQ